MNLLPIISLHFIFLQNMIKTVETTVGRRYAGWFIRNGEYAQRVLDGLKHAPLPAPQRGGHANAANKRGPKPNQKGGGANGANVTGVVGAQGGQAPEKKVAWNV